ncbi:MAG: transcriptional regulator [Desulfobacteraceae bacterium]|nr:transcriptional regulator [Desulfobacteraceae bacterium]
MARGDQLGRQWKILQMLIDAKTGRSVADIADRLACHTRTVYRDLEALQTAGFPVYDEKQGGKSLWFMLESRKSISMPLSMTELMALYFGRDFLNILKDSVFHDSLKSLSSKIKETLPEHYQAFLERFETNFRVRQQPYKQYTAVEGIINKINTAIDEKKCIDISYFAVSRKTASHRRVAPYNIWFANGTFYITGHCQMRHEIRTFACDRISDIEVSDEYFTAPEDFAIDDYLQSSFGVFHGRMTRVKIWFSPEAAMHIKERQWHASQEIIDQPDGSIIFTAQTAGIHDIRIWVLSWGAKARVLAPESLKKIIKSEIEALNRLYE